GTSHRFQRTSPTPLRGPGLFSGSEGIDCARGLALPAVAGPSLSVDCVELRGLTSASHSTLSTSSRTLWEQVIAFKEQARPPYGDRACSAEAKGLTARGASRSPLWRGRLSQWTASSCADFGPLRHRLRALRVEPYGYKPSLNAEAPSPIGSGASAEAKGLTARGASRSPLWRGRLSQWTASSCADFGPLRIRLCPLRVEPCGNKSSLSKNKPDPLTGTGLVLRKRRDSNPWRLAPRRFSKPVPSTTRPRFRARMWLKSFAWSRVRAERLQGVACATGAEGTCSS